MLKTGLEVLIQLHISNAAYNHDEAVPDQANPSDAFGQHGGMVEWWSKSSNPTCIGLQV